jgi:hypothetical protein
MNHQRMCESCNVTELLLVLSTATRSGQKDTEKGIATEQRLICPSSSYNQLIPLNKGKGSDQAKFIHHVKKSHRSETKEVLHTVWSGSVTVLWTQRIYVAIAGSNVCWKFLLLPLD